MLITQDGSNIVLKDVKDFDLLQIFECGQCFRFERIDNDSLTFKLVAMGRKLIIKQNENELTLFNTDRREFDLVWYDYFSFATDYSEIKEKLSTDETIKKAIQIGEGIRILKQDLWETVISFIVSQNNNIPRIKKCIEALCTNYGRLLGENTYAFPSADELSQVSKNSYKALGLGYRDEYIYETVKKTLSGEFSIEKLSKMPTNEAREYLLSLKGVGGKVADCILLFGMHRYEVCPHDVWVKRIFTENYGITDITEKTGYALAREKWKEYAGIAQQYLFYAKRSGLLPALSYEVKE